VYVSSRKGDVAFRAPILADTAYLQDAHTAESALSEGVTKETRIVFELTALDRMWFGETFPLTLVPN